MKENKECLGSKDVAWILDLSPDDVVESAGQKKLVGAETGRLLRFRPDDVETYKKQQQKRE